MTTTNPEPKRLRDGGAFHKKVQAAWVAEAEGDVEVEKTVTKIDVEAGKNKNSKKKSGRLDVFVSASGGVFVIEQDNSASTFVLNFRAGSRPTLPSRSVRRLPA